ncbi:hypothetical protein DVH05_023040 [Phytophthora capsici]|nr:hypothetical protein DVH05_023040 [Phytophthora capsici]
MMLAKNHLADRLLVRDDSARNLDVLFGRTLRDHSHVTAHPPVLYHLRQETHLSLSHVTVPLLGTEKDLRQEEAHLDPNHVIAPPPITKTDLHRLRQGGRTD